MTKLCHLTVGPSFASFLRHNAIVSLGIVSSDISHVGPDFVFATMVVLVRYTVGLVSAKAQRGDSAVPSDRQAIHGILAYSRDRSVVDPLSTIQPSYLVQRGVPDKLRKDTTFKFLVYLRTCLRFLDEHEREALHTFEPGISIDEMLDTLQTQWFGAAGDDDSTNLSQQTLLQELFKDPQTHHLPKPTVWELPYESATFALGGTHLTLRHPTESLQSNLICGPIAIVTHQQKADFLQPVAWMPGKSFPNIATHIRERHNLLRLAVCATLDHISSTVYPEAVEFMQVALHEYRRHSVQFRTALKKRHATDVDVEHASLPSPRLSPNKSTVTLSVDCTLSLRSFTFTAAAQQLVVRFKHTDLLYGSSVLATPPAQEHSEWDISTNQSLVFGSVFFEGCSAATTANPKERILASLALSNATTNIVLQQDTHNSLTVRVLTLLEKIHLDVPRSALRLHRFLESWRADYLPGLDTAIRALLAELHDSPEAPSRAPSQTSRSLKPLTFQVQLSVTSVKATLQVMHGTWVSWEVRDTIGFLLNENRRKGVYVFGIQMGPHVFEISRSRAGAHPNRSSSIRLELPTITFRGRQDPTGLQGLALVEFFHVTVRPSDWDTLLSVQQKSGQDFNDLIHIIEQTRQKKPQGSSKNASEKKSSFRFNGSLKMKGFRIGLEGLASTLFLECDDISGGVGNHSRSLWHVRLSDLALSLASQSSIGTRSHRDRRSAFVRVDIEASMYRKAHSTVPHLQVSIPKIHAVMQPSSIGELGDFVDHLQVRLYSIYSQLILILGQAEIFIRKEQRANDLEEFKEKTRSLMKSLDVKTGEPKTSQKSLLEMYTASVVIQNIGVAFPLTLARDLQMSRVGSHDESAVKAFLFSIKTLKFGTQLGENGQASMTNFSFQFVSRYVCLHLLCSVF